MDSLDVSYVAAVAGGLLSFFSPCVLPLVLPFLAWCGGIDLAGGADGPRPARMWVQTLAFVAGFVSMFVAFGALATAIGRGIADYQQYLSVAAGVVLVVIGLHVAEIISLPSLDTVVGRREIRHASGPLSAYVVGLSFAFGWSPCVGPILAAILTLAGTRDSVAHGTTLLALYGGAMAAPFLVAGAFAGRFQRFLRSSAVLVPFVRWSSAVLIIATGIGIMTGTFWYVGFWMLRVFPGLSEIAG